MLRISADIITKFSARKSKACLGHHRGARLMPLAALLARAQPLPFRVRVPSERPAARANPPVRAVPRQGLFLFFRHVVFLPENNMPSCANASLSDMGFFAAYV